MSITKFFNRKYAIQNIKKSKAILGLLFIIVPIITLFVMHFYDVESVSTPFDFSMLFIVNYLGMYIIPFVVSVCLMGFSYKKTSVDFVCSMPLNKKTIYITNLISGIIYLVSLQLFTLIITSCYMILIPSTLFSISMAVDVFLMMTFSYIFVYSICMLASSISGNIVTQIVVSLLVLFLIPFTRIAMLGDINYGTTQSCEIFEQGIIEYIPKSMTYSLPITTFIYGFESNSPTVEFKLVEKSMIYSMVLLVIYSSIGMVLFEKRKLENAGTSFQNDYLHSVVKGLTLYPIVALLVYIRSYENIAALGLAIVIMAVYYIIYDMITFKKIKAIFKAGSFIVSVFVLYVTCFFMINTVNNMATRTSHITSENVSKVYLRVPEHSSRSEYIEIQNNEIKDYLLNRLTTYRPVATKEYPENNTSSVTNEDSSQYINIWMMLEIKGNKYFTHGYIKKQDIIEVIEKIRKDKDAIDAYAKTFVTNGKMFFAVENFGDSKYNVNYSKDLRDFINNNKLEYIDKMLENTEKRILKNGDDRNSMAVIEVFKYYNHKKQSYALVFMPEFTDIEQKVVEELNREAIDSLKMVKEGKAKKPSYFNICLFNDGKMRHSEWGDYNDIRDLNFIIQEASNNIDITKEYYSVSTRVDRTVIIVCTNNIDSLKEHNFIKSSEQYNDFIEYRY